MPTPSLDYFLSNYFHQDFYDDFGDEWGALDTLRDRDPHRYGPLPVEIEELLRTYVTEAQLEDYADRLGCEFNPSQHGGYRAWLTEVARRVSAATTP